MKKTSLLAFGVLLVLSTFLVLAVEDLEPSGGPECIDEDGDGYGFNFSIACSYIEVDCDDTNASLNLECPTPISICPTWVLAECEEGYHHENVNGTDSDGCPLPPECVLDDEDNESEITCANMDCAYGCTDGICWATPDGPSDDDDECSLDSDCDSDEFCDNGDCEEVDDDDKNETQIKEKRGLGQIIRNRVKAGVYTSPTGEQIRVRELAQNRYLIIFDDDEVDDNDDDEVEVETELEIEEETENGKTKLKVKLKNGRNAEIKIMPGVASEVALARLRLKACSEENECEIKLEEKIEEGKERIAYKLKAKRKARFFGIFPTDMNVDAEIDAETGELIGIHKPWWAFLAAEPEV